MYETRRPFNRRPTIHLPTSRKRGSPSENVWGTSSIHAIGGGQVSCGREGRGSNVTYYMGTAPYGQTDKTENITFPKTTYVGGNKTIQFLLDLSNPLIHRAQEQTRRRRQKCLKHCYQYLQKYSRLQMFSKAPLIEVTFLHAD